MTSDQKITPTVACRRYGCWINPHTGACNRCGRRVDTETTCHCGADYRGSDHCPECHCEQYESGDCGHEVTA